MSHTTTSLPPLADPRVLRASPATRLYLFAQAKSAQGHPISQDRMDRVRPPLRAVPDDRPDSLARQIWPHQQRVQAKLTALIARRAAARNTGQDTGPTGGDAA